MAKWDGKSKGSIAGYKILISILRTTGLYPVYVILVPVSFYYFLFSWKTNRPTYWYFRKIHRFSVLRSVYGIFRSYYSLAVSLVDKVAVFSQDKPSFSFEFTGEENLKAFTAGGKGGILLNAHMGNWEVAGHFLKKYKTVVNLVALDVEDTRLKELLSQTMVKTNDEHYWNRILITPDGMDHVFGIREALQRNELVCMPADRFMEGQKTVTIDFMGYPAAFPCGPFQLASVFRVPVSMTFGFKESASRYHLFGINPIFPLDGETKNAYMERATRFYVHTLEGMVRRYPYQWFNFYNFWTS